MLTPAGLAQPPGDQRVRRQRPARRGRLDRTYNADANLPIALEGLRLGITNALFQITALRSSVPAVTASSMPDGQPGRTMSISGFPRGVPSPSTTPR